MKTRLKIKCKVCGYWNRIPVNKALHLAEFQKIFKSFFRVKRLVLILKEPEVAKLVKKWLRRKYPENQGFEIVCKIKRKGADCTVKRKDKLTMQVEVKGSKGDVYNGLGQCMWYFHDEEVKTYLAVPYDLPFNANTTIKEIKKVMEYNEAKFGLLEVTKNGNIKIVKDATL